MRFTAPPITNCFIDKKHVDTLLKYGAYDLFKEDLSEGTTPPLSPLLPSSSGY